MSGEGKPHEVVRSWELCPLRWIHVLTLRMGPFQRKEFHSLPSRALSWCFRMSWYSWRPGLMQPLHPGPPASEPWAQLISVHYRSPSLRQSVTVALQSDTFFTGTSRVNLCLCFNICLIVLVFFVQQEARQSIIERNVTVTALTATDYNASASGPSRCLGPQKHWASYMGSFLVELWQMKGKPLILSKKKL